MKNPDNSGGQRGSDSLRGTNWNFEKDRDTKNVYGDVGGKQMLKEMLDNVRKTCPLVHNITNYVTVNDCANILLACGGSPIMADDVDEVEDITTICGGLNINIGTLNQRTIPAMHKAGKKANELGHPVVLDPVGAGASCLRTKTANDLIDQIQFSVIRGNISEIKTLALGSGDTRGVDAAVADSVTEDNLSQAIAFAKAFAQKTGSVIAITGAIDIVADAKNGDTVTVIRDFELVWDGKTNVDGLPVFVAVDGKAVTIDLNGNASINKMIPNIISVFFIAGSCLQS